MRDSCASTPSNWSQARTTLQRSASSRTPTHADPSIDGVDELLASTRKAKADADIAKLVDDAIAVAKNKCASADNLLAAWSTIRGIKKADAQYARAVTAVANLERCRKTLYQELVQGVRTVMKTQRETIANRYERDLLGKGMDVHVYLGGSFSDRLTIQYVLFNRAWAFKITDGGSMATGGFLESLQQVGFKRVTFSDGYNESFSYDLAPMSEEQAVGSKGLNEPFRLQ